MLTHLRYSTHFRLAKGFPFQKPQHKKWETKEYIFHVYSRSFAQGDVVYLELLPQDVLSSFPIKPRLFFNGREMPLSKTVFGYRSFFGIPTTLKPGSYPLQVQLGKPFESISVAQNQSLASSHPTYPGRKDFTITVRKKKFSESKRRIYIRRRKKALSARKLRARHKKIHRFIAEKKKAYSRFTDEIFIRSELAHPLEKHYVTSPFWIKRHVARFQRIGKRTIQLKPRVRIHKGIDLRARTGTPIYSIADGRVVIAKRMVFEGNFVLVEHGQGIFSGYMHLSKINVRKNKKIRSGQLIGYSGATGAVSGAHLHLLLQIRNVPVDPLSLLSLPVRDETDATQKL